MTRRRNPLEEERLQRTANLLGLAAAALLIAISLLVLTRLEHRVMRRDCYVQKIHACASIGSGRYTHF